MSPLQAKKIQLQMTLQTMITLSSAAFGLVVALAWNEAIKATMKQLFDLGESLAALYAYAILATIVGIVVLIYLTKLSAKVGGEAMIDREAEG